MITDESLTSVCLRTSQITRQRRWRDNRTADSAASGAARSAVSGSAIQGCFKFPDRAAGRLTTCRCSIVVQIRHSTTPIIFAGAGPVLSSTDTSDTFRLLSRTRARTRNADNAVNATECASPYVAPGHYHYSCTVHHHEPSRHAGEFNENDALLRSTDLLSEALLGRVRRCQCGVWFHARIATQNFITRVPASQPAE